MLRPRLFNLLAALLLGLLLLVLLLGLLGRLLGLLLAPPDRGQAGGVRGQVGGRKLCLNLLCLKLPGRKVVKALLQVLEALLLLLCRDPSAAG